MRRTRCSPEISFRRVALLCACGVTSNTAHRRRSDERIGMQFWFRGSARRSCFTRTSERWCAGRGVGLRWSVRGRGPPNEVPVRRSRAHGKGIPAAEDKVIATGASSSAKEGTTWARHARQDGAAAPARLEGTRDRSSGLVTGTALEGARRAEKGQRWRRIQTCEGATRWS